MMHTQFQGHMIDSMWWQFWKCFSTMGILSSCNQVPVAVRDIPKMAFATMYGLFEFTTMPFGLMTAPATYQELIELALSGLQWSFFSIYLDDIIVFSRDFDEQLTHIGSSSLKLQGSNVCSSPQRHPSWGTTCQKRESCQIQKNVAKIMHWPVPKTVCNMRGTLGLGSYYHHFIRNFSDRVWLLVALTKKDKPFYWTKECQKALDGIKWGLIGLDVMSFLTNDGEFIVPTNVSDGTTGAVLTQIQTGVERVIVYGSWTQGSLNRTFVWPIESCWQLHTLWSSISIICWPDISECTLIIRPWSGYLAWKSQHIE